MVDYVDPETAEVTRLPSNRYWLLMILAEGGTFRMRELRRRTRLNPKTIRRYVDKFLEEGYNIRVTGHPPKVSYTFIDQKEVQIPPTTYISI